MKISLSRDRLLSSLTGLSALVEKRHTLTILSHVLCKADSDGLRLTASNMEMSASDLVPATVEIPGEAAVPAHLLGDIAAKLPEGSTIVMQGGDDGKRINVTCGNFSNFKIPASPADQFPPLPDDTLPIKFKIKASALGTLFGRTGFAMSREETRRYLGGICLHIEDKDGAKILRAVATDGHRLALAWDTAPKGSEAMPSIIIPRKAVEVLTRIVEKSTKDAHIALSENRFSLEIAPFRFTTRLVDASFPDYAKVIPDGKGPPLTVDCKPFQAAVNLVSTISVDRSRFVKLSIQSQRLTMETSSPDGGEGHQEVSVDFSGDPVEIGFNAGYLMEMAGHIGDGKITFVFADETTPTLVRGEKDGQCLYVLMPMRV